MVDETNGQEATISDESELEVLREGIDDPVVLKGQLKKEAEARRQLTARAKKAEAEAKEAKEALIKTEETSQSTSETPTVKEDERLELRLDGYTKDEVTFIMNNGGRKSLEDKTSYVALAINQKREQTQAEIEASKASGDSGLSDLERQIDLQAGKTFTSPKELKSMLAEMEKALPHAS